MCWRHALRGSFDLVARFGESRKVYILKTMVWRNKWGNYCNITLSPFVSFWTSSLLPWNLGEKNIASETLKGFPLVSWQLSQLLVSEGEEKNTWNAPSRMLLPGCWLVFKWRWISGSLPYPHTRNQAYSTHFVLHFIRPIFQGELTVGGHRWQVRIATTGVRL